MKPLYKSIITLLLLSIIISSILWMFIEIPLLNNFPRVTELLIKKTGYAVEKQDEKGIPIVNYPLAGMQYNPLFIANQALFDYQWLDKQDNLNRYLACTDWLMQNHIIDDNKAYYPYKFDHPTYQQKNPWYSALAQATILNAVYSRYNYNKNKQWLLLAQQTLASLVPDTKYRLGYITEKGGIWFSEYPSETPYYVLNGMMAVLIELNKYYTQTSDSLAMELFDKGYSTLLDKLPEYDTFYGSKYDLVGNIASMSYHQMHIDQLMQINAKKPNPLLKKYIKRWTIYRYIPVPIQLVFNFKVRRCIVFVTFWLGILMLMIIFKLIIKQRKPNHKAIS